MTVPTLSLEVGHLIFRHVHESGCDPHKICACVSVRNDLEEGLRDEMTSNERELHMEQGCSTLFFSLLTIPVPTAIIFCSRKVNKDMRRYQEDETEMTYM